LPHFGSLDHENKTYNLKLEMIRPYAQCTYPPSFIMLCLIIQKLSCWPTKNQTSTSKTKRFRWQHPPHSAMLCQWRIMHLCTRNKKWVYNHQQHASSYLLSCKKTNSACNKISLQQIFIHKYILIKKTHFKSQSSKCYHHFWCFN